LPEASAAARAALSAFSCAGLVLEPAGTVDAAGVVVAVVAAPALITEPPMAPPAMNDTTTATVVALFR
jgi:hypothetical protein